MDSVQRVFGVKYFEMKANCIICSEGDVELFVKAGRTAEGEGIFCRTVSTDLVTVLAVRPQAFAGDLVLQLEDSACRNIFLFGGCTGAEPVDLGKMMMVQKAFNLESFSEMLKFKKEVPAQFPDESLLSRFFTQNADVAAVTGATVSSSVLAEKYLPWFSRNKVACVDRETSAVYAAAEITHRKALSLRYVNEIVPQKGYDDQAGMQDRGKVSYVRGRLAELLLEFIDESM